MNYTWHDIKRLEDCYNEQLMKKEKIIDDLEMKLLMKDTEINNLKLEISLLKGLYLNQPPNIAP